MTGNVSLKFKQKHFVAEHCIQMSFLLDQGIPQHCLIILTKNTVK